MSFIITHWQGTAHSLIPQLGFNCNKKSSYMHSGFLNPVIRISAQMWKDIAAPQNAESSGYLSSLHFLHAALCTAHLVVSIFA